ncbi:hypothetical protein KIPB_011742, partial [Kipferlia bialata]|eukprot:g11742.t1
MNEPFVQKENRKGASPEHTASPGSLVLKMSSLAVPAVQRKLSKEENRAQNAVRRITSLVPMKDVSRVTFTVEGITYATEGPKVMYDPKLNVYCVFGPAEKDLGLSPDSMAMLRDHNNRQAIAAARKQ